MIRASRFRNPYWCLAWVVLGGGACNGNLIQGHVMEPQTPPALVSERKARFAVVGPVAVTAAPGLTVPPSISDELQEWTQKYMGQVGLQVVSDAGLPHDLDVHLSLRVDGAAVLMRGSAMMDVLEGAQPVERLSTDERIDPAGGFGRSLARDLVELLVHARKVGEVADARGQAAPPAVADSATTPPATSPPPVSDLGTPDSAPPVVTGAASLVGPGAEPVAAPPPVPSDANVDDIPAAKAHTRQGAALYDLGRYADANAEFERAYLIEQDPALLYNMGQCHRKLGNADEAVHFFRTYLRRSPNGPFAGAAEKRIHEIETESATKSKNEVEKMRSKR